MLIIEYITYKNLRVRGGSKSPLSILIFESIEISSISMHYCSAFGLLTYFIIARKVVNDVTAIP